MLEVAVQARAAWLEAEPAGGWDALCGAAAEAGIAMTPYLAMLGDESSAEIAVLMTDNGEVQQLNCQYRDKDKPTNVLSFPQIQGDLIDVIGQSDDGELLLGDIVLAFEVCRDEAETKGIALTDHVSHLVIHGCLHLLGYDHSDDCSAEAMEALERDALARLGLADPYALIEDD